MASISLQARFGTAGGGLDLLGVGSAVIWPESAIYFALPALVLGTALIFISVLPARIFESIAASSWRAWFYGFIPLHTAARKAYELTRHNLSAAMAEADIGNFEADPLGWYGTALIGKAGASRIDVFGCKPKLDFLEQIPPEEINSMHVVITDTESYFESLLHREMKYHRLYIRRSDMKKRIEEIKSWG